ncbi:hypothetical protein [Streptomyces californicus]|uniref:hypothetical protein n=1 Tax=Streptomyces californicus TaxID=67351 RepID=UPI00296FD01F|nr:hypothetical protein [Streptomyces californicus]MDW4916433.1 hypothetical protein [Streptomyces californicus]
MSPRNEFRLNEPGAPAEDSDAGPARDLGDAYVASRVRYYRQQAVRSFEDAQRLVVKDAVAAEEKIKQSLNSAAKSFWWAEDSSLEDRQHQLMHKIGRWKRKSLGCSLHFDGKEYVQRCPVAIAHKKMGFSIGFTATRMCSLCRHDLASDDCPHFRGQSYWVRGGADANGSCRVCVRDECKHRPDTLYRASVVGIVSAESNMVLHEVSIVRKPAQPEARLTEIPIDIQRLAAHLGPNFLPGVRVSCDQCLGDCPGFVEFQDGEQ